MRGLLAKHWFLVTLALGVTVALTWPATVRQVTAHLPPAAIIAVALFLMSWTMPSRSLAEELRFPWAALWAVLISYGVVPLLGWLAGALMPTVDGNIGLQLSAAAPTTLASCVLWTRLAGGNDATALLVILISTLSSWLFTTLWLGVTTGVVVEIDPLRMMGDLALTLAGPVLVGQGLRFFASLGRFADAHRTSLGVVAQLLIFSIIVKTAAEVGARLHEGTAQLGVGTLVVSAVVTSALHLIALYFGLETCRWLGIDGPRSVAVALSGSQKTLPVALLLFERYYMAAYPLAIVPLLFYHVGQLIWDTLLIGRLRTASGGRKPPV